MDRITYRTVSLQAVIALFSALALYFTFGEAEAKSAFFGGTAATANGLFLLRKLQHADKVVIAAPSRAQGMIYFSAVVRYVLVLLLFGVAFGVLDLKAVPALVVFAVAQLAYGWGLRKSYKDLL
jgi:small-conductance mechanosensitive channel